MSTWRRWRAVLALAGGGLALALPGGAPAGEENPVVELVEGTAVLLNQASAGGDGGSGGNAKTASSMTNIFAPGTFVDYKRFGGEPTVTVDRYPFPGIRTEPEFQCPPGQTTCFKDIVYQSAPQGVVFPRYSQFWKSDDLGQSFKKSQQFPIHGLEQTNAGGGGGDSHQDVGELTHNVYFVDLALDRITMNVSRDLGETWDSDPFGEGLAFLDDRQWVEADETAAEGGKIYVSTINLLNLVTPTLAVFINATDWPKPFQIATSPCNPATFGVGSSITAPAPDATPTPCPDPADPYLWVAGPVVADDEGTATRPPTHHVYIPFIRRISEPLGTGLFGISAWELYIARSTDLGKTWTRHLVAALPNTVNPANIFPQLTIDRGGNLYYTWSQAQAPSVSGAGKRPEETHEGEGEQDVYYTWSKAGGLTGTWAPPINLTKEQGDSAIFPWLIAGDPGRVDITMYKANSGINSNIGFVDENGEECEEGSPGCRPNPSVWNTYFGQSQNALNTGPNFNIVQVTAQPNHIGQICTGGTSCEGDRDLLDFITIDVDHLGAAHIGYSDDNRRRASDTQDFMTRQIAGNSVFKDQNINLTNEWPIRDHTVTDRAADVTNTASAPIGPCPGMDLLAATAERRDDRITITLTLNGAPTAAKAIACGNAPPNPVAISTTGGLWGAEFWAAADPATTGPSNRFYIAYRDNPPDGAPRVEGGTMDHVNVTVTSLEFNSRTTGTLAGTCFPATGPPATGTCTIAMTVSASSLGITPGNALNSITGISTYLFGNLEQPLPATRVLLGNSEQADATAALHYLGSGTP